MTNNVFVSHCLMLTACLGMMLPQQARAASPVARPHAQDTADITLRQGGLLIGQVVNRQGQPRDGVVVSVRQSDRELVRLRTDRLGRFAVKGLKGGTFELATAQTRRTIRVWTDKTAPPAAARGALLVEGTAVRGQEEIAAEQGEYVGNGTTYYEGAPPQYGQYGGNGQQVVRPTGGPGGGVFRGGRFFGLNPWIVGTGIAAAIAIPVALDDDDAS